MQKVIITTTVKNSEAVCEGFEAWAKAMGVESLGDSNEVKVPNRQIVIRRMDRQTILCVDFDGGYTVDAGFTYEFNLQDEDMKMVFKGHERDYGYGDIRHIMSGCEVSEVVEITNLVLATKIWPK